LTPTLPLTESPALFVPPHTSSSLSPWSEEYWRLARSGGGLTGGSFQLIRLLANENWSTDATHLQQTYDSFRCC
jgi:hypothetical protein